jgi:hypothetical protein
LGRSTGGPRWQTLALPFLHDINPLVSRWWTKLKEEVCHNDSNNLLKPVSPTVSPIRPFVSTHPPGMVVTVPSCTADGSILPPTRNRFFVVNSTFVEDGVENCMVRELHPNIDPLWRIDIKGRSTHVKSMRGHTYRLQAEATEVEEFAASLTPVVCKWVQITTEYDTTQHALIHKHTIIRTRKGQLRGDTTLAHLQASIDRMREGVDDAPLSTCHSCTIHDAEVKCATPECLNMAHVVC